MNAKTAIIYCRVSTDRQWQQWESLDVQEKECRAYCERMHIDVVEVFREQFTGTSIQRPALNEALNFLKKQKKSIDFCIIHKLDRSTRWGLGDYYEIKKKLESSGTKLKDAYGVIQDDINVVNIENFDTNIYDWAKINPSEIAVSMTVLSAKQERSSILQRTIPQEIRNTQNGYISRPPHFGYQNHKICTPEGKLKTIYIPHPEESRWIIAMYELRAQGNMCDADIVNAINGMGFKTRSMKKWNKSKTAIIWDCGYNPLTIKLLQYYIKNPIYVGIICEKWTNYIPVRWKFQWLVSRELFNRANREKVTIVESKEWSITMLHGKEKNTEKVTIKRLHFNEEYPFSRVLRCPHCSGFLTPNKSRSGNGKHHYYYQCNGRNGNKHKNYTERRDEVNSTIISFLSHVSFNDTYMPKLLDAIDNLWNEKKHEIESKKHLNLDEVLRLEEAKQHITKNIEKFIEFPEILKEKNIELANINAKLNALKSEKFLDESEKEKQSFIEFTKNIFKHIGNTLEKGKTEESMAMIFDILFEELPTYENIQFQTTKLYPIFALQSKKHTIDDVNSWGKIISNLRWQSHLESNQGL